jgi:predicted XRE-type DNA-binding protein
MTKDERAFLALVAIGFFSIDGQGRIWRHRQMVGGSQAGTPSYERLLPEPTRAETSASGDYPKVMFSVEQERMAVYVHRAVWMTHNRADIPAGMQINHIDGDPTNPRPTNLELVTVSGNVIHAIRVLGTKRAEQKGIANNSARLSEQQVREIRRLTDAHVMAQSRIAESFGVSQRTVSEIHLRKTWRHLPD